MAGNGTLAPVVFRVMGLNARELRAPFVVLPIPGLCIEGGLTPGAQQQAGYVFFTQGGSETPEGAESAERQFFAWYRAKIGE